MLVGKLDETAGSMLGGIRVHRSARSREGPHCANRLTISGYAEYAAMYESAKANARELLLK
jgi:hypothetical protein